MSMSNPGSDEQPVKRKWPLKTLIEILPVLIALSVFFNYSTRVSYTKRLPAIWSRCKASGSRT